MNVDGRVSSGGLGGPAILPQALAMMSQMTRAFPDASFSGIGGISDFGHALNYFLLGCGTVQVCTAAMLDHAIGPNVIARLARRLQAFFDKHADRGWNDASTTSAACPRPRRRALADPHVRDTAPTIAAGYERQGVAAPR